MLPRYKGKTPNTTLERGSVLDGAQVLCMTRVGKKHYVHRKASLVALRTKILSLGISWFSSTQMPPRNRAETLEPCIGLIRTILNSLNIFPDLMIGKMKENTTGLQDTGIMDPRVHPHPRIKRGTVLHFYQRITFAGKNSSISSV